SKRDWSSDVCSSDLAGSRAGLSLQKPEKAARMPPRRHEWPPHNANSSERADALAAPRDSSTSTLPALGRLSTRRRNSASPFRSRSEERRVGKDGILQ